MMCNILKFTALLACVSAAATEKRQNYVAAGIGYFDSGHMVGNLYNYWQVYENGTFDLSRSAVSTVTSPKLIPMTGWRTSAIIEPSRSVLCMIDMQNFFLHPALAPTSTDGRAAVDPTIKLAKAFRNHGIKVAWVNWGLNKFDLLTLPASVKLGFSSTVAADQTIGSDMGLVKDGNETIEAGAELMAGSWNVQPYENLKTFVDEGVKAGTDLRFNKNRLSGLWGAQTPFGMWLQENEITTIFIGGVDADQCVRSTYMDAYFKGFDFIYVDDIACTRNGPAAYENTRYTANYTGFIANSADIINALGPCQD